MKTPRDYALGVLQKAANDLIAGRATIDKGQAFDTVCYHAQQSVEKYIKAVLISHEVAFPKRHDLGELLLLVAPYWPEIADYQDRLIGLTPYSVEVRYDPEFNPSIESAQEALFIA